MCDSIAALRAKQSVKGPVASVPYEEKFPMGDEAIKERIKQKLKNGLETEVFPRADTYKSVQDIRQRLEDSSGSLEAKLVIGGFTLEAVEYNGFDQACDTCMYYLVHRKYCNLPELELPVEPKWSCRLWRI